MELHEAIVLKQMIASEYFDTEGGLDYVLAGGPLVKAPAKVETKSREYINGIGISFDKHVGYFVKIFTKKGMPASQQIFQAYYNVKQNEIVYENIGPITFAFWNRKPYRREHRPPKMGNSVSHIVGNCGTLGCFVKNSQEEIYILGNNHILANLNRAKPGDIILQPGLKDGGNASKPVAFFADSIYLDDALVNQSDAAIAMIASNLYPKVAQHKSMISGNAEPEVNMPVEKNGRSSSLTTGVIDTIELELDVDYNGKIFQFNGAFEVKSDKSRIFGGAVPFSKRGDSGSLIIETTNRNAVGLLFAISDKGRAFCNPIIPILAHFKVGIL